MRVIILREGGNIPPDFKQKNTKSSITVLDEDTKLFNGPSHDNGGIPLSINGQKIEVEGGETLYNSDDGNAVVLGNLTNPLTGRKFKQDSKILAKKEQKVNKLMDYSTSIVNNTNPFSKWDSLKFNAGSAMMIGSKMKKDELSKSKEHLAELQQGLLSMSEEMGVDPQALSKGTLKAKKGMKLMSYQNGGSLAQRHNNPGNIMYANWEKQYGAEKGDPRYDSKGKLIGYFAKFPDVGSGQTAMKSLLTGKAYKNLTVAQASAKWTGEGEYNNIPAALRNRKISDLNPAELNTALDTFTLGEDSKKYNWDGIGNPPARVGTPQPPYEANFNPNQPNFQDEQYTPRRVDAGQYVGGYNIHDPKKYNVPSNAKGLDFDQILPEAYAAATNRVEPVFMQQYNPELYEPYQVSFQDRRNLNNQTFRAVQQKLSDNPNALATLAGQKYEADNQVNAEEFRTNQAISNDITNKNIGLLNDAQSKNLQLADTQYVRQETARAKTKAVNQSVLNSVSSKILQNRLENKTLQVYENLYPHFRYDEANNMNLEKEGAPGQDYINYGNYPAVNSGGPSGDQRSRITTGPQGELKSTVRINPSELDTATKQVKLQNEQQKNLQYFFNTRKKVIPKF